MTFSIRRLMHERREHARFRALPPQAKSIVFYSEGEGHWPHLRPIVHHLTKQLDRKICYVTSSETDPILEKNDHKIDAFYIGEGIVRTSFFMQLRAGVMVMTMPDLETYHVKRSKISPVHYTYVFHSIVSTHMIYRAKAFDHFDTILTVGPHHDMEIRATESLYGLKSKKLVPTGSGRLDTIIEENRERVAPTQPSGDKKRRVLVAPSWGPQGLIETCGAELAEILLTAGFDVVFRPHPMTSRTCPQAIEALRTFEPRDRFKLEMDVSGQESLHASHLMISDWSGSALEYAFGLERPVVFVDVPRKINNSDYHKIAPVPIEVSIREQIGEIVAADNLARVPVVIDRLCDDPNRIRDQIRSARQSTLYNLGASGQIGANAIDAIARDIDESHKR